MIPEFTLLLYIVYSFKRYAIYQNISEYIYMNISEAPEQSKHCLISWLADPKLKIEHN